MAQIFNTRDLQRPGFFRLALAGAVYVDHTSRLSLGLAAVALFFVLSGFWISSMWTERYTKTRRPYFTYLVSRGWRLLPVALLTAGMAWGAAIYAHRIPAQVDWLHEAISNLTIFGYNSLTYRPNGPEWSLDIEAQFYVLAPLLIALIGSRTWALGVVAFLAAGAALLHDPITVVPYLAFFAIGVLAARNKWQPTPRVAATALVLAVLVLAGIIASPYRALLLGGRDPAPLHVYTGVAQIALAVIVVPWAIYTTRQADTARDRMFGDLSFITYLVHWPVLQVIDTGSGGAFHRLVMIATATGIIGAASLLIWRFYDYPLQHLRHRWVSARKANSLDQHVTDIAVDPRTTAGRT